MRPTLHEYTIEQLESNSLNINSDVIQKIYNYAKLTNRQPKLGDFVPCDEDGDVMDEPIDTIGGVELYAKRYQAAQDRVIFKGEWRFEEADLLDQFNGYLYYEGEICLFVCYDEEIDQLLFENEDEELVSRIEDLPPQIEFKEGVI